MPIVFIFLIFLLRIYDVSGAAVGTIIYGQTRDRGLEPWKFDEPIGVAVAPDGTILVADSYNNRIQSCYDGFCKTVAGGNGDGNASHQLKTPYGVTLTSDGRMLIADTRNNRVMRWDAGATSGVTILGAEYNLKAPVSIVLDEVDGYLFVADTGNHAVLRFRYNPTIADVYGEPELMAGFRGNYSENLTHLDNPVSIFFDKPRKSLWIADARNFRIIRWPLNESSGYLEVDNLPGRPYGVFVENDVLYYSDADDCVVWKRLTVNMSYMTAMIAGTGECGSADYQLWWPSGFVVHTDGTLTIADTRNHRISRWMPNPNPATNVCMLSRYCDIETRDANPTAGNLLVVVSKESTCGGVCYPSGLLGNELNVSARPEPPLLRDVFFQFGIAMLGSRGDYKMCWGAAVADNLFETTDEQGRYDCSHVPITVGVLTYDFFVFQDENGTNTQCVRGAVCWVIVTGYAIPREVKLLSPPPDDWTGTCGESTQENFLGYRASLDVNPSSYPVNGGYEMPFNDSNWTNRSDLIGIDPLSEEALEFRNMTTVINQTFGLAQGSGRVPICLCADGEDCTTPYKFTYAAGTLQIRSVIGDERWYCVMDTLCTISVRGTFLKDTDRAMIVAAADRCSVTPSINGSDGFENPIPSVSNFSVSPDLGEDYFETTFELGNASLDRMFRLCYCASYDNVDVRKDQDDLICNMLNEFTQSAGVIGITHVYPADFECPITHNCTIPIWGVKMMPKKLHWNYITDNRYHDKLLMEFGTTRDICGKIIPLEGVLYDNPNVYDISDGGNTSYVEIDFGAFRVPGVRALCWCSTYEAKLSFKKGPCNDEDEFYQPIGKMVVRGPIDEPIYCIADVSCFPTVRGTELSDGDLIQVCPDRTWCGSPQSCPASGPGALDGILQTIRAAAHRSEFSVGTMPLGLYALCYCAAGRNGTTFPLNCSAPEHLGMSAGDLRVRGSNKDHRFSCVAGNPCRFTVTGFDLSNKDHMFVSQLDSVCGYNGSAVPAGTFYPSSQLRATAGTAALVYRHYHFTLTLNPGRFRVCYCVYDVCDDNQKYHLDAGLLFLKGLLNVPPAFFCRMKTQCTLPLEGYGLREDDDAVQILPRNLSCGGIQVIVEGDLNSSGLLNGSYIRQDGLVDGRHWYVSSRGQYLYFDVYAQRWIMGPALDPDLPDVQGPAYSPGRWAMTPDVVDEPWRTWDPDKMVFSNNVVNIGFWTPEPYLHVRSSKVPNGTFGEHPTRKTTNKTRDETLGAPYLLAETFHLGSANKLGAYKICYCPSLDGQDYDNSMCSNDDEYIADVNILVVRVVRGNERFHCSDGNDCIIRTVPTVPLPSSGVFYAALVPAGAECYNVSTSVSWRNSWKIQGAIIDGELRFNLGNPWRAWVEYTVCVCTDYDNGADGVPCSELSEYFQDAGNLTIAPLLRLDFEFGSKVATFNVTRFTGLSETDRMRFVIGDDCSVGALSDIARPNELGGEAWAAYPLGADQAGGVQLDRGLYSACFCADYDGPDSDDVPCNNANEFQARVGLIFVMVIRNPMQVSSVEGRMTLSVIRYVYATAATPLFTQFEGGTRPTRRVSNVDDRVAYRHLGLARDIQFANVVSDVLHNVLIVVLNTSPAAVIASVNDVVQLVARRSENEDGDPVEIISMAVNFTASLHGDTEQHLIPGSDCINYTEPDNPDNPAPLKCLKLTELLKQQTSMLYRLNMRFSFESLAGIAEIEALDIDAIAVSDAIDENYDQVCVRDAPCNVSVASNGFLTGSDKLLISAGSDGSGAYYCGPTSLYPGGLLAVDRGVEGFPVNPVPVPGGNSSSRAVSLTFTTGSPKHAAIYNLCYCWANPGVSCQTNREFYQTTGTLTVRGPLDHERVPCIANARCLTLIEGIGLSAWDRIAAIPKSSTCGSTARQDGFVDGFHYNPGGAEMDKLSEAFRTRRYFDLGVAIFVGEYRICYCVSSAKSNGNARACEAPEDFGTTAGTLRVRGIGMAQAVFSIPKSDVNVAAGAYQVTGYGILPQVDSVYMSPLMEKPCNALPKNLLVDATGKSNGITPNPVQLVAMGQMDTWAYTDKKIVEDRQYTDKSNFTLNIASQHGTYRVCSCAAQVDAGGTYSGGCGKNRGRDFFNQIGSLKVRGVGDGQLFICEEGLQCSVTLRGVHLSMNDQVEIIGPADACGRALTDRASAVEKNRGQPKKVSADETSAEFDLGSIAKSAREMPVTFRICYCANFDGDGNGHVCSNSTEFTHTGGFINTVLCPQPPPENEFIPPVTDIFGDPGDPRVELFMVPSFTCLEAEEEDKNLGSEQNKRLGSRFPLDKQSTFNFSVLLSSSAGRCDPSVDAKLARMNMLELGTLDLQLVDIGDGSITDDNLKVGHGYVLEAQAHVEDLLRNRYSCPKWQITITPYGCSWGAALWLGLLLHGAFALSGLLLFIQNRFYRAVRWLSFLKAMAPRTRYSVGSKQAQLAAMKETRENKLHSSANYAEWQLQVKKDLAAGGELRGDVDRRLVAILSSRMLALFFVILRTGQIVTHVWLLFMDFDSEFRDRLTFLIVPGGAAVFVLLGQLILMLVARGCRTTGRSGLPVQPLLHSLAAASKVHLDLVLPVIARRAHCEVWRVATVACVGCVFVQVVLPVGSLIWSLLPAGRHVSEFLVPLAASLIDPQPVPKLLQPSDFEDSHHDPHGQLRRFSLGGPRRQSLSNSFAIKDAIKEEGHDIVVSEQGEAEAAKETDASAPEAEMHVGPTRSSKKRGSQPTFGSVPTMERRRSFDLGQTAAPHRPAPLRLAPVSNVKPPSRCQRQALAVKARCISCCSHSVHEVGQVVRSVYWNVRVTFAEVQSKSPEVRLQNRLVSMYAFMEASGWYASNKLIRDTVEHISGVCLQKVEAHWTMLTVLCGGVDLTAMHAFVLIGYSTRLSAMEVTVLGVATFLGVIFGARPGIVRAFHNVSAEIMRGPLSCIIVVLLVGLVRFLASSALYRGCPLFTWAFSGWCLSILVVEVPLLLIWIYRQNSSQTSRIREAPWWKQLIYWLIPSRSSHERSFRESSKEVQGPAAGAEEVVVFQKQLTISSSPVHSPLGRVPGPKFPGFAVAEEPEIEETVVPGHNLPDRLDMTKGRSISREELMRLIEGPHTSQEPELTLEERMVQLRSAEKALKNIDGDVLRNPIWRFQLEGLHTLANNEMRKLQLAARAVNLTRSRHFKLGSLCNRAQLALAVLPEAASLRFVHWRTIYQLERLPNVDEYRFLSSPEEIWKKLKTKAVVVAVIHRWRGNEEADLAGITARQLVVFALWYRERWGKDLELFYWIDCSCLPKEMTREQKEQRSQAGARQSWASRTESQDGRRSLNSSTLRELEKLTETEKSPTGSERKSLDEADARIEGLFGAGPDSWTWKATYDDYDVTTESSDALMPLVFACSDAVVVCEAKDSETRAWVHLEIALAYAFAPTGNKIYSIDQKLGVRRRTRRKVEKVAESRLFQSVNSEARESIQDHIHPEAGLIFGNAENKAIEDITGEHPQAIQEIPGTHHHAIDTITEETDGQANDIQLSLSQGSIWIDTEPSRATTSVSASTIEDGAMERPRPNGLMADASPLSGEKASTIWEDASGSDNSDSETMKKFASEAIHRTNAKLEVRTLVNPLRWDYSKKGDRERIARLLRVCLVEPSVAAAGGYRRQAVNFHPVPNIIHTTRLEGLTKTSRKAQRQARKSMADPGAQANLAMLKAMGIPEAVAKQSLGLHEDEEDSNFEKEEEESFSDGDSLGTAFTLNSGPLELPSNRFARMDRNERPISPNSNRVYAHVRKRLDWEERTMDLYYHHRWHKQEDGAKRPLSASNSAQLLVDKAAIAFEGMSDGATRPSTANSSLFDRPMTAMSGTTESLRPSSAQSGNTNDRPITARSNRSGSLDEYDPSGEGPLFAATRAKIEFKHRPFGGVKKEAPRQETAAENLLRRAASGQHHHTTQCRKQPLSFYAAHLHGIPKRLTEELFHPDFHPSTVLLGEAGQTVMQLKACKEGGIPSRPTSADATSGGIAVTMHQLPIRRGVAPEEADVRGVCFEVIVETVDLRWKDGLAIGFTAQDPDRWNRRRPQPRHAYATPKTWVCGYNGRWALNGQSEMIRPLRGGLVKTWQPGRLQVGDSVTAVAAPPPADTFRILVNGQVVAERPLTTTGLANLGEAPLWGIVDVDGSCLSVRLSAGTAFGERPRSALARPKSAQSTSSTRSRSEPKTLLGSTMPLGLRSGALQGPDRKGPATSELSRSQERKRPATADTPVRPMMSNLGNRATASSLSRFGLGERPGTAPTSVQSSNQRPGTAPPGSRHHV